MAIPLTSPSAIITATEALFRRGDLALAPRDFGEALLAQASWFRHDPGEDIVSVDEPASSTYALADGIACMRTGLAAADVDAMHMLHPGQWLGFTALFDPARQIPTGYVTARSTCIVARVGKSQIEALLALQPQGWRWFGAFAVRYGDIATGVSADLSLRDSKRRCFAMLLRAADARHASAANTAVALVGQDELGAMANLSRNTTNRILGEAEAAGLLTARYRAIALHDVAALRHIVSEG